MAAQAYALTGKKCFITGASRGIGKAIAIAYAKENAELILCSRKEEALKEVASICMANNAAKVQILPADLSNVEATKAAATKLLEITNGYGVDVLVNNAGIISRDGAKSGDVDDWTAVISTNLLAPMTLTRMLSDKMIERKGGAIINIGSVAALEGMTQVGVYSASKFGLRGWSLHSALNLKPYNIKVTLISPGFVATDMAAGSNAVMSKVIQPEDIAEAAMLPLKTSYSCCPEEINVKVTGNCFA